MQTVANMSVHTHTHTPTQNHTHTIYKTTTQKHTQHIHKTHNTTPPPSKKHTTGTKAHSQHTHLWVYVQYHHLPSLHHFLHSVSLDAVQLLLVATIFNELVCLDVSLHDVFRHVKITLCSIHRFTCSVWGGRRRGQKGGRSCTYL